MISKELAGDYVMYLYNNGFILGNRVAAKTFVQRKFRTFLAENNRTLGALDSDATLDELLNKFGFICKLIRDEKVYKFDYRALFAYRNEVTSQLDRREIEKANSTILSSDNLNSGVSIHEKPKVLEDFPSYDLLFQFRVRQQINESFILSSKGCYCCQLNFLKEDEYAAHIEYHSQETDFEYRNNQSEVLPRQFTISYRLCENSHLLFSIKSLQQCNVMIEKVIVFRPGSIHYLEEAHVPYFLPQDGSTFYVNCHIFQIAYEQPLLVIFKSANDPKGCRYVEEHHFLRFDVFPSNINLKTKHVLRRGELQFKDKIPEYTPTPLSRSMHFVDFDEKIHPIKKTVRDYLRNVCPLNDSNISDVFDLLVEMEDFALSKAYEKLYRKGVKIQGCGSDYSTRISGLLEEQESILSGGDRIILILKGGRKGKGGKSGNPDLSLQPENSNAITKFYGMITSVLGERVYFESKSGKLPIDLVYECTFEPQRLNIKYQHRALELLRNDIHLRARLFPEDSIRNLPSSISLEFCNTSVAGNPEQREAVQNIVDNNNKNVPFILFGPPGTGKTTVVVEAILQLWRRSQHFRILVTAGSNAACDEVASRLCKILNKIHPEGMNLLRIYSASYEKSLENINEDVLEASNLCYGSHFYPSLETIYTYPIVVATLAVAGRLVHGKIANNHFTHVFIDECGASTEPESLLGLSGILSSSGHLIISGDPKQLGPIIECRRAARYGLERSLLERLMNRECYRQHPVTKEYNRSIQARLIRNFRSHKDILALSNQLYYDNELKVEASPEVINLAIGWSPLRSKNFPILFESVKGFMRKLRNSTSSCNYEELAAVMLRLKELMFFGIKGRRLAQKDIGIISPYKSQCQLLRRELDQRGWYQIETGSVETFQGQEKPIIIASMVRSRVNTPGFLDNPKRLNVLLTRAQALLIIVGNPDTLKNIGDWKFVVEYCVDNKALIGVQLETKEEDGSNESDSTTISQSMQDLSLKDNRNNNRRDRSKKRDNKNQVKRINDSAKNMKAKKGANDKKGAMKNARNNTKAQKDNDKEIDWKKYLSELPNVADLSHATGTENHSNPSQNKVKSPHKKAQNTNQKDDFSQIQSQLKGLSDFLDKPDQRIGNEHDKARNSAQVSELKKSDKAKGVTNAAVNKNKLYPNLNVGSSTVTASSQQFSKGQPPNYGPRNHSSATTVLANRPNQSIDLQFSRNMPGQTQNTSASSTVPPFGSYLSNPGHESIPRGIAPQTFPQNQSRSVVTNLTQPYNNHFSPPVRSPGPLPQSNTFGEAPIHYSSGQISSAQFNRQASGTYGGYPYPRQLEPSAPALGRQEIILRQPAFNPGYSPSHASDSRDKTKQKEDKCVIA